MCLFTVYPDDALVDVCPDCITDIINDMEAVIDGDLDYS